MKFNKNNMIYFRILKFEPFYLYKIIYLKISYLNEQYLAYRFTQFLSK